MNSTRRTLRLLLVMVLPCVAAAGCSAESSQGTVRGTVMLDGTPLAKGVIRFVTADGPVVEAIIDEGAYSATVPRGDTRIEIMAPKVVGQRKMYETPDSPTVDRIEELLPARYNTRSELSLTVSPGRQQKDFQLQSE